LFVAAFTAIGAARRGYDWRRDAVSSLAVGPHGWYQRINFVLTGLLYCCAAAGLGRSDRRRTVPRAVPVLVAGAGVGLIGSGLFVTDHVGGPRVARARPTRTGRIHDICGLPVFVGIPIAGVAGAVAAVRSGDHRWASYSAGSSAAMAGSLVLMGGAIRGRPTLRGRSGLFQRISLALGLGWLSSLSFRSLRR
jgi:Protein of unknown function (DUF998)